MPLQHPVGQDVASHTHEPPTHSWPAAQAAPLPHLQTPPAVQLSAWMPQSTQAAPEGPHVERLSVLHTDPVQHPAQEVASQTHLPDLHSCPAPQAGPPPQEHRPPLEQLSAVMESQATHPAPPTPHVESDDMLHVPPEQQP